MIAEVLGWLGTSSYFLAYIFLTVGFISMGEIYLSLNIVAAILVIIVSVAKASWSAVAINFFWALITLRQMMNFPIRIPSRGKLVFQLLMILLLGSALSFTFVGNHHLTVTILAWCSTIGYSLCYLLFLNRRLRLIEFHGWNFLLAVILIPQLLRDNNWPVIVIEIFWAGIALWGILRRF